MRIIAVQANVSVRVLNIFLTTVTAASLCSESLATGQTTTSPPVSASGTDWKQVETAMGRAGQMQLGDMIKFGMPRKDLHILLDRIDVKPGLALGSWAAFKREADGGAMLMGDLVLTEDEV